MKRRTLLQGAIVAATAALTAKLGDVAATRFVGTGCVKCRPDLFPALGATVPLDANHHAVRWADWSRSKDRPAITLGGVEMREVNELYTGPNGWLIKNHRDESQPGNGSKAHLCACGSQELQIELWRGDVQAPGIYSLTAAQIIEAERQSRDRLRRWEYVDSFSRLYPAWVDQMWAEQKAHPGMVPALRREVLIDYEATALADDGYYRKIPGRVYLIWKPMGEG